ncbi:hypothetical protein DFP94_1011398 [Fontibacillus phaseoli]|uniref:Uncharacterized protein n=1 Tax=Fontibacillus phaseoli TaxID=1416533 RepID=A0A369BT91_9BACL|nr:hypothetical protein [Fontibacillus phaseoli]RCX23796.1 hypothetical protein DFP94_1011398 [Fontibacillus phaseoli]
MREGRHKHRENHQYREHMESRGGHETEMSGKQRPHSAQTFRRGRAIAFLERLNIKRSTLLRQLDQPEYESIKQVISGELKATDAIIQEFIHSFELREAISDNDSKNEGADGNHDNI